MRRPPPRSTRTDSLFPYTTRFRSETGAMLAGLVRDPDHDVPIATIGGVLIAGVVYIVSSVLVMGIVPAAELDASNAPFAPVAAEIFGPRAAIWTTAAPALNAHAIGHKPCSGNGSNSMKFMCVRVAIKTRNNNQA